MFIPLNWRAYNLIDGVFLLLLLSLLKGRSIPGKILLSPRSVKDNSKAYLPIYERSFSFNDAGTSDHPAKAAEVLQYS